MAARRASRLALVAALGLMAPAGCSDDDNGDAPEVGKPVAGTFVGEVARSGAVVSVVAAPTAKGERERSVTVFACDAERHCEQFSDSEAGNDFSAQPAEGDGQAKGRLSATSARGTIELRGGKTVSYRAAQATAATGLYDLTVARDGALRGVSAAGVSLSGTSSLPSPGGGSLKLADGRRVRFEIKRSPAGPLAALPAGRGRLMVLPSGQLRGVVKGRESADRAGSALFIRTSR